MILLNEALKENTELKARLAKLDERIEELDAMPAAAVTAIRPRILPSLPLSENVNHSVRLEIINRGPQIARNSRFVAVVQLMRSPVSKAEEETFLEEWAQLAESRIEERPVVDLGPNDNSSWHTVHLPITREAIDGLAHDRQRLYVYMRFEWEDRGVSHTGEYCVYLNKPTDDVWRYCGTRNTIR